MRKEIIIAAPTERTKCKNRYSIRLPHIKFNFLLFVSLTIANLVIVIMVPKNESITAVGVGYACNRNDAIIDAIRNVCESHFVEVQSKTIAQNSGVLLDRIEVKTHGVLRELTVISLVHDPTLFLWKAQIKAEVRPNDMIAASSCLDRNLESNKQSLFLDIPKEDLKSAISSHR